MAETSVKPDRVKPGRRVVKVTRTQVNAAQLLVELDERLGEPTPEVIKKIAEAK